MKAYYFRHLLNFKRPSGTSRGILTQKETWFIVVEENGKKGIGECGILRGLSFDDRPDYEDKLSWVCDQINQGAVQLYAQLMEFPSIQMGLEMAFRSLKSATTFELFPNAFTQGTAKIPINGLIWMGDEEFMLAQIEEKIEQGFDCIKMKVGAIDFEKECALLAKIRSRFSKEEMILRVDANGAFETNTTAKLARLAEYELHSIEQPIPKGNWRMMRDLCQATPLPIALDEELIGVISTAEKVKLLDTIQPQFIILKPSFIGGFTGAYEWFQLANERGISSWVTSALESNIGLNAIAQWTFENNFQGHQGLGTGSLFTNNFDSPLEIKNGYLSINTNHAWNPPIQINF